jgi:hypothetical protein
MPVKDLKAYWDIRLMSVLQLLFRCADGIFDHLNLHFRRVSTRTNKKDEEILVSHAALMVAGNHHG